MTKWADTVHPQCRLAVFLGLRNLIRLDFRLNSIMTLMKKLYFIVENNIGNVAYPTRSSSNSKHWVVPFFPSVHTLHVRMYSFLFSTFCSSYRHFIIFWANKVRDMNVLGYISWRHNFIFNYFQNFSEYWIF